MPFIVSRVGFTEPGPGAAVDDRSGPPARRWLSDGDDDPLLPRVEPDDPATVDPVPTPIPPRRRHHTSVRFNAKRPATAREGRPSSSNATTPPGSRHRRISIGFAVFRCAVQPAINPVPNPDHPLVRGAGHRGHFLEDVRHLGWVFDTLPAERRGALDPVMPEWPGFESGRVATSPTAVSAPSSTPRSSGRVILRNVGR